MNKLANAITRALRRKELSEKAMGILGEKGYLRSPERLAKGYAKGNAALLKELPGWHLQGTGREYPVRNMAELKAAAMITEAKHEGGAYHTLSHKKTITIPRTHSVPTSLSYHLALNGIHDEGSHKLMRQLALRHELHEAKEIELAPKQTSIFHRKDGTHSHYNLAVIGRESTDTAKLHSVAHKALVEHIRAQMGEASTAAWKKSTSKSYGEHITHKELKRLRFAEGETSEKHPSGYILQNHKVNSSE